MNKNVSVCMKMMLFSKLQLMQILETGITFELENRVKKSSIRHYISTRSATARSQGHRRFCDYCVSILQRSWKLVLFYFLKEWNSKEALLSFPSSREPVFCTHKPASHFSCVRYSYILSFGKNQCLNRTHELRQNYFE